MVAGGPVSPPAAVARELPADPAVVIAADSGVEHAHTLGLSVDTVIGDFDSIDDAALAQATAAGAALDRHPHEKDQTDLELALDLACVRAGAGGSVVVVASVGGRLDHALANLFLLASPAYAGARVEAYVDEWHVTVVRDEARIRTRAGAVVTLLPIGGDATGIRTQNLTYPLKHETLPAGTSRGVSNVAESAEIVVAVESGVLFALWRWAD